MGLWQTIGAEAFRVVQFNEYRPSVALRPGDAVAVNIYEAGGTPLFSSGGGRPSTTTPNSPDTTQQAPVSAAPEPLSRRKSSSKTVRLSSLCRSREDIGRTPHRLRRRSEERSRETANSSGHVSLTNNVTNAAQWEGVNRAGLVQLTLRGEKLLTRSPKPVARATRQTDRCAGHSRSECRYCLYKTFWRIYR